MAKGKKTGGRQKGVPNKDNPLKEYLRNHSIEYFVPKQQTDPETGQQYIASDYELDLARLAPDDRVNAELRLLEFHTPKTKAVDLNMELNATVNTIEDTLRQLSGETDDNA